MMTSFLTRRIRSATTIDARDPIPRVVPQPSDINANGHISRGWVLAQMDIAGGILAGQIAEGACATDDGLAQDRFDRSRYFANVSHAIDTSQQATRFINRQNRFSLGAIFSHPRAYCRFIVVGATFEFG